MDLLYVCQETRCFEFKKKKEKKKREMIGCAHIVMMQWNYMEQNIRISFDIQTHLTVVDVLFAIKQHNYGNVKTIE